jgi:hypothetical protein
LKTYKTNIQISCTIISHIAPTQLQARGPASLGHCVAPARKGYVFASHEGAPRDLWRL